jgi:hypothetical protein
MVRHFCEVAAKLLDRNEAIQDSVATAASDIY